MRTFQFSAVIVGAVLATTPAMALTQEHFDFTDSFAIVGDLGVKSETFLSNSGDIDVEVTAVNANEPPPPTLTQTNLGLGVRSGSEVVGQVDNRDPFLRRERQEALFFVFDVPSTIDEIEITLGLTGDEWSLWGTTDTSKVNTTGGDYAGLVSGSTLIFDGFNSGTFATGSNDVFTDFFIIADSAALDGGDDNGIRVAGLKATAIPLPAAAWLLLAASGGLVAAKRRSKKAA